MSEPAANRPYCAQPALRGDRLVFAAAGELWLLDLSSDTVPRRLTDSTGTASRPVLSPDGAWLAFQATDDGPPGLWLMELETGNARRLVHHPMACQPLAFEPDGSRVYFAAGLGSWTPRITEIHSVSLDGGDLRREPWGPATNLALADDGNRMVLGRGYQDPAAWKRYEGGRAGSLWAGTREPLELASVSPGPRGDCCPGFWGERLVFLSDQDGCGNIWSSGLDGSDRRRHTEHGSLYARWPAVDGDRVVYQRAGDLRLLDLGSGRERVLDIRLGSDISTTRRRFVEASRFLEAAQPSPDGRELLVVARGKALAMPAWRGPVRSLGDDDGVRYSLARWMPDGKRVVLAHDASGEDEIEIRSLDGSAEPQRLGRAGEGRLRLLEPSPDGKTLALSEHAGGLQLIDLATLTRRAVASGTHGAISELAWSPDSRWLAYVRPGASYRGTIRLFDLETGTDTAVTDEEFDDSCPVFDPGGRWLWFLSRRVYNPWRDELEHDVGFPATTRPHAVVLSSEASSPFAPTPQSAPDSDEESEKEKAQGEEDEGETEKARSEKGKAKGEKDENAEPVKVRVDLEGIARRVVAVPVDEGRHSGLLATKDKLFLLSRPLEGIAGRSGRTGSDDEGAELSAFDLEEREDKLWVKGVRGASLSSDGKQLLLRGAKTLRLIPTSAPPKQQAMAAGTPGKASGVLDLSRLRLRVEPRAEWRQIFREAWRQQREHFWTECMSRVDWDAMYARYAPLVERLRARSELSDLLWDLQGELGTSHAYVMGGDAPPREVAGFGLLGADFELDAGSGRYRLSSVLEGDSWSATARGPLAAPGVNARPGDWLLAIDGCELRAPTHPLSMLEKPAPAVTLTLASGPDGEGARDVVVEPLTSEEGLRYREWVRANQRIVDARGEGRIGYVHVPDMQLAGLMEFHRGFLWQAGREALIVDVRDNGGGNVSQILLGKLRRQLLGYCKARWAEPLALPHNTLDGPMVALCNERTGSDGDIFCQSWRQLELGPLIGQRTWGGVVGIDQSKTLVDGGSITQPEYAFWFENRGWDVEGRGVAPDIEVAFPPSAYAAGEDPQLERGIDELMAELKERGPRVLELPPPPDRSR